MKRHQSLSTGFQRRIYTGLMPFVRDLRQVIRSIRPVLELSSKTGLAVSFRERIMLVVTAVNRCRHCAFGHELLARRAGLSKREVSTLLSLDLTDCPEEELPALQFAMHWAESDGQPLDAAVFALHTRYGQGVARQIEVAILMIQVGNRIGNTFDYWLSRVSRGRFGLLQSEREMTSGAAVSGRAR